MPEVTWEKWSSAARNSRERAAQRSAVRVVLVRRAREVGVGEGRRVWRWERAERERMVRPVWGRLEGGRKKARGEEV